ncbi:DUF1287 domain-containing protein [Patescibacteria group bacterium]
MPKLKIFALIAVLTLTLILISTSFAATFTDVSSNHQHYEAITHLQQKGIIQGYNDGSFKPDAKVARAESLKMILLASGTPIYPTNSATAYNDIEPNAWFARYVNTATDLKIVKGYEDGSFKPANNVNLAEAIKMGYESFGLSGLSGDSGDFWYDPYKNYAADNNITWQEFDPAIQISRAQLAELLYRFEKAANPFNGQQLVDSARKQIGIVTNYDTSYYSGGYPPADSGACTDVIEHALRDNGYDLKTKLDNDMWANPGRYPHDPDPNINYRRVINVKAYLEYHAQSLSTCTDAQCFNDGLWQPGDIVTYNQMEGGLWHIAIISNKKAGDSVPYLVHNGGGGVKEQNMLLTWPATISGHYRFSEI